MLSILVLLSILAVPTIGIGWLLWKYLTGYKECHWCKSDIDRRATVCPQCKRDLPQ